MKYDLIGPGLEPELRVLLQAYRTRRSSREDLFTSVRHMFQSANLSISRMRSLILQDALDRYDRKKIQLKTLASEVEGFSAVIDPRLVPELVEHVKRLRNVAASVSTHIDKRLSDEQQRTIEESILRLYVIALYGISRGSREPILPIDQPEGITVYEKPNGAVAVVRADEWSPSFTRVMVDQGVRKLELNAGRGWNGNDVSFLRELPTLTQLNVIGGGRKRNIDAIESLQSLRGLNLQSISNGPLRLNRLSSLRTAVLEWQPHISFDGCDELETLAILNYKARDLEAMSCLRSLRTLSFSAGSVRSLHGIERAPLARVTLLAMRFLEDVTALANVGHTLETLTIDGCNRVVFDDLLGTLTNLHTLYVDRKTSIASIAGLRNAKNLKSLKIFEAIIEDGDLEFLKAMQLETIRFTEQAHYSAKQSDFASTETS